jgi:Tetratricopeptide repeat
MNRRVLAGSEKVLGVEHPITLTSVSNLVLVLQDQGKYEAVEEMLRRALAGREKVLGVEHPDTLTGSERAHQRSSYLQTGSRCSKTTRIV